MSNEKGQRAAGEAGHNPTSEAGHSAECQAGPSSERKVRHNIASSATFGASGAARRRSQKLASLLVVLGGFVVLLVLLGINERGIPLNSQASSSKQDLPILSREETQAHVKVASGDADTLLVYDTADDSSQEALSMFRAVMSEMRVSCNEVDLAERAGLPDLAGYTRVVLLTTTPVSRLPGIDTTLVSYVNEGGSLMVATMPYSLGELGALREASGITAESTGEELAAASFKPAASFMLGGGQTYTIEDPDTSSISVELADDVTVEAEVGADGTDSAGTPLVWERDIGSGKLVVCNLRYYGKAYRGVFSSAFSLLGDACVWPVINASTWWLDDFPSPVPQGDSQYIQRDYHMSVAEFYSNVWWPDVLELSRKHDFSYSGAIIETYEKRTSGSLGGSFSTDTYLYYGNQLLNSGGEIGYHGYNHQPLCGPNYAYVEDHGYSTWESTQEMSDSISELESFTSGLFEGETPVAYVPPSNILSDEGRSMLVQDHPEIRAIASTYLPGGDAYDQEFTVAADGEIEMPRIVSGEHLDSYMRMAALSELNLHYVNSHFMHPDDLLDADRGASEGWEALKGELEEYMDWVQSAAPDLTQVTASGMAARVQRFANATPAVTSEGDTLRISLDGFHDKCWLMLRTDGWTPTSAEGGNLTQVADGLWLLECTSDTVSVTREAQ